MSYQEQPDDGLTEQERAALSFKEEAEDTTATTSEDTDVNPEQQQPAAAAEEPAPASGAAPAADPADGAVAAPDAAAAAVEPQTQAEAAPAKASDVPAQPAAASAPILIATAPEDAQGKLAKIADDKKALAQKYEDGEITGSEMSLQLDALNEQALEIKMAVREAEMASRMEQQRLSTLWVNDCNVFLAKHPEYADEARGKMLDDYIRALSQVPSNANLTNMQALEKAHKMVKVDLGEPLEATATAQAAPAAAAKPAKAEIPKPAAQPNIGSLPAASMNDTTGGEFAALDRLQKSGDLEAYESAVERLTEAQRARYLRA